ncbi:hypothetical protein DM860_017803 [Cuscuta australis]|uniref:Uncharacterized protein n=1 Tax=Cuscuta australis TaxID=267555 RepID=A0A328DRJ2_9ASTE|nr:hypothetical protein DM860_017803 [Cuscuta australis]
MPASLIHPIPMVQVVAPTQEQVRNPILENLRALNLNLPPASTKPINPEMIVVNQEQNKNNTPAKCSCAIPKAQLAVLAIIPSLEYENHSSMFKP